MLIVVVWLLMGGLSLILFRRDRSRWVALSALSVFLCVCILLRDVGLL